MTFALKVEVSTAFQAVSLYPFTPFNPSFVLISLPTASSLPSRHRPHTTSDSVSQPGAGSKHILNDTILVNSGQSGGCKSICRSALMLPNPGMFGFAADTAHTPQQYDKQAHPPTPRPETKNPARTAARYPLYPAAWTDIRCLFLHHFSVPSNGI